MRPIRVRYGEAPSQFGELRPPVGVDGPWPVAVVLHGGFWWDAYDLHLMDAVADDLAVAGWAAWNVEYRRLGADGGGWPTTFSDVAAAVDHVAVMAEDHPIDLSRVVTVGHSAGGHLALWAAGRPRLPTSAPGAEPLVGVARAVSAGGVTDLVAASAANLGRGAATSLLGGRPDEVPERYAAACPSALLPMGVDQVLVHGADDDLVPAALSEGYAARAEAAGDSVVLDIVPGAGHFDVLDPSSRSWQLVRARLAA